MNLIVVALASALASISVTDGDTLTVAGETIRIANIDAPETRQAKCDAERRLGLVAKRRLAELVRGAAIAIARGDPADGRLKDRHGRTLATLSVNGRDIGETLVAEGLARPWTGKRQPWCLPN